MSLPCGVHPREEYWFSFRQGKLCIQILRCAQLILSSQDLAEICLALAATAAAIVMDQYSHDTTTRTPLLSLPTPHMVSTEQSAPSLAHVDFHQTSSAYLSLTWRRCPFRQRCITPISTPTAASAWTSSKSSGALPSLSLRQSPSPPLFLHPATQPPNPISPAATLCTPFRV